MHVASQVTAEVARDGLTDVDGNPAAAVTEQARHQCMRCASAHHDCCLDTWTYPVLADDLQHAVTVVDQFRLVAQFLESAGIPIEPQTGLLTDGMPCAL
jgi:hypothetical protein